MLDANGRTIDYLRISVTDRCNLRCLYCMPEEGVTHIPHEDILSYEEIIRICNCMAQIGIKKIKITGGEPLVRKDLAKLIKMIKEVPGIVEVTLTTNGVLLDEMIEDLVRAGLDSINISLDSLNKEAFYKITGRDYFEKVMSGLSKALSLNLKSIKINCVPIQELNFKDIMPLVYLAKDKKIDIRFIELMPIGFGKSYTPILNQTILDEIEKKYGKPQKTDEKHGNGPAVYYHLEGFKGSIGFISALSHEFCKSCSRIRLSASGDLKLCLHYNKGTKLKTLLQNGITDDDLIAIIKSSIYDKPLNHCFNDMLPFDDMELKNMVQIGG